MPIPESQLDTWAKQGSISQSADTYATIKNALEAAGSPYASKSYDVFLQGSYGNDTNVFKDSDVDVVIQLTSTYYYDTSRLAEDEKTAFQKHFVPASYTLGEFKTDVAKHLEAKFPMQVHPRKKAIDVEAKGNRRSSDVLVATDFRRYYKFNTPNEYQRADGLCFLLPDGTRIENFPRVHSARCTDKHKDTAQWFKPTVRIFKNMRNRMIEDKVLAEGVAPSYYLEGMLYNVPKENFGKSYQESFIKCFNWIANADKTKLVCAHGLEWLVRDNSPTSWATADFDTYMKSAAKYWTDWCG
ncbi:MAG: nucleotidyltransferase [Reyranella sp.]|nr:nucleotidyltransferase [Reyranella sp.]